MKNVNKLQRFKYVFILLRLALNSIQILYVNGSFTMVDILVQTKHLTKHKLNQCFAVNGGKKRKKRDMQVIHNTHRDRHTYTEKRRE